MTASRILGRKERRWPWATLASVQRKTRKQMTARGSVFFQLIHSKINLQCDFSTDSGLKHQPLKRGAKPFDASRTRFVMPKIMFNGVVVQQQQVIGGADSAREIFKKTSRKPEETITLEDSDDEEAVENEKMAQTASDESEAPEKPFGRPKKNEKIVKTAPHVVYLPS